MFKKILSSSFLFITIILINTDSYMIINPPLNIKKNVSNVYNTDFKKIQEFYSNEDIIARLEIPSLLNIFLVKSLDNDYYLNHNLYKNYDIRGTPFIDYRSNFIDNQINIYGHNSRIFDLPFKYLTKYLDYSYFKTHNIIYLENENGIRTYRLFLLKEVSDDLEHMYVNNDIIDHIDKLTKNAIYVDNVTYNENSEILIIQTCTLKKPDSYYILCAIRI